MKQRSWMIGLIAALIVGALWAVITQPAHLGLDLVGGVRGVFQATSQNNGAITQQDMDTAISVINRRVNNLGVSETQVQQKGADQLVVEIPLAGPGQARHMTADQAEQALMNVVKPAVLAFIELPDTIHPGGAKLNSKGEETYSFTGPGGQPIPEADALAQATVILTGKDLLPVSHAQFSANAGNDYAVSMKFDDHGAQIFGDYTSSHVGKPFGVTLDNHLITFPNIREPITTGDAEISGGFSSLEDAQHLATLLNSGALPVNLKPVQTSLVEATLGASAVRTSIWAGAVGLALVIVFMWGYYRLPGVLASLALVIYSLLVFAIFKLIPVTLTLPGIAGFILSVGMAVDANILIFERLKEEMRAGKTLRAAIDAGFGRAFTAIFDSNACTLITCAVLGFYGTGPVKGFAVTLAIGVLVSLFTAITVTRTFLHFLDNLGALQKPEYFGINIQWMGKWAQGRNIIGNRKLYYSISLGVIVPGLIALMLGHLHLGVDFTGGNEWIIQSRQALSDTKVIQALQGAGIPRNEYDMQIGQDLRSGDKLATIHSKPGIFPDDLTQLKAKQKQVIDDLHKAGVPDAATASNEQIHPLIGKELEVNALKAILIASILIVLYLSFRFAIGGQGGQSSFKNGVKYGVCAVIAMLHDVFVVVGIFAILGWALQIEVDMNFVTALLTIIGFSVHDTIVIFDRVRENLQRRGRDESFEETYNKSIVQTAARSINTSFTVVLVLVALALFGAPVIFWFNIALLVGIISGTYSSIFNASPLVVDWQLIKRRREAARAGASGKTASGGRAPDSTLQSTATRVRSGASNQREGARPASPSSNEALRRTPRPGGSAPGGNGGGVRIVRTPQSGAAAPVQTVDDLEPGAGGEIGTDTTTDGETTTVRPRTVRPAPSRPPTRRKQRY